MRISLDEAVDLGFKEVIVQVDGYIEGRVFQTWQPFRRTRDIKFQIVDLGDGDYMLEHKTFWIVGDESKMDYYWEGCNVYLRDAEIMAEIGY